MMPKYKHFMANIYDIFTWTALHIIFNSSLFYRIKKILPLGHQGAQSIERLTVDFGSILIPGS